MDIYTENILDHYKHPLHKGHLTRSTHRASEHNVSCGDKLEFELYVKNGKIQDIAFDGSGCAISQAAASMLTDKIIGKALVEIKKISNEDIYKMLGVPIGPGRVKCALLAISALRSATN